MKGKKRGVRILVIIGLVAMILGAVDPLEGSFVILMGSGLMALGAFISESAYRPLAFWAFGLVLAGVAVMVVLSILGGVGGSTRRSPWWLLTVLPYPVGWIMSLVAAVRILVRSFKKSPVG